MIQKESQIKKWVEKGGEFYNRSMKLWLDDNQVEMYLMHNEEKSVVAEGLIRTLKSTVYKYKISISKNVHINKLDDIVNEYNNTYHKIIKMKPIDVKNNTYINSSKEVNHKDPIFQVGDYVRISKNKKYLQKDIIQIRLKKLL